VLEETLPATVPDPAEQRWAWERLRHGVERLLGCLSPSERVALVGRHFAELTYAELSDGMRCSEAAVRQLHHRATVHLRAGTARYRVTPREVDDVLTHLRYVARTGDVCPLLARLGEERVWRPDVTSAERTASTRTCSTTSSWQRRGSVPQPTRLS
jgi:RNA polymerase sigma-70 factor (ECF subfamily)